MEGVYGVDFSLLLSPEPEIPFDVYFKIVTTQSSSLNNLEPSPATPENEDSQNSLPAHKFILASVSPVFRRQFYGSIPEGEVVDIKDSSVKAFKIMIRYIYQKSEGERVEDLIDVHDVLDIFYLAEKYEVSGLMQQTLKRLSLFPVNASNFGGLLSTLHEYSNFEEACKVLENRVLYFIKNHKNHLELVQGAIDSENDVIRQDVLTKLASVGEESILETVKAAHDIIASEGCKLHEKESMNPVMSACVRVYEVVHRDPLKYFEFLPEPNSDLHEALSLLLQWLKNNFCKNCKSAACKKGEKVNVSDGKVGSHVLVNDGKKGVIREVGLVKVPKFSVRGKDLGCCDCGGGGNRNYNCKRTFSVCAICTMNGSNIKKSCSGLHSSDLGTVATDQCTIMLGSGEVVTKDYQDIVFACE